MENASKALLMAGGILVGIIILSLMVTLFSSASIMTKEYDESRLNESVQRFNANFIKYVGKDLTIHDVVTISNFAIENGVTVSGPKGKGDILGDVENYSSSIETYNLEITSYYDTGYIKSISIST